MDEQRQDPESLLENIGNLDTARMTLRWALERIRGLERTVSETQGFLKQATAARENALRELEASRESSESRIRKLEEKERFVTDMQGVLNSLFKGEVDVTEFVRRRRELEETHQVQEARLQERLRQAEEAHQKEVEQSNRRLSEMEAAYTGALADAQRSYREQVGLLEKKHAQDVADERAKAGALQEEVVAELRLRNDEFHQRLVLLELELSTKRQALEKDFERLKAKLLDERRADAARLADAEGAARASFEAEREKLEALLAERERRVLEVEDSLRSMEREFSRRSDAHEEDLRAQFARQLKAQAEAHERQAAQIAAELSKAREALRGNYEALVCAEREAAARSREALAKEVAELRERIQKDFADRQAERSGLLQGQGELLREETIRLEQSLAKLEQSFSARSNEELQRRVQAIRALEEEFRTEGAKRLETSEADLEALRKYYDGIVERQRGDQRKTSEAHARELQMQREASYAMEERLSERERELRKRDREELQAAAEAALQTQRAESTRQFELLQARQAERESQLRLAHEKELAALQEKTAGQQKDFERQVELLRLAHEKELAALQEKTAEQKKASDADCAEFERQVELMQTLQVERERQLREVHQKELAALRQSLEADQAEKERQLRLAHEDELAALRKSVDEARAESAKLTHGEKERQSLLAQFCQREQAWEKERAALLSRIQPAATAPPPKDEPLPVSRPPTAPPPEKPRRWLTWALRAAVAAAAGAAGGLYWVSGKDYRLPFSHPTALLWEGETLWAADWSEGAVYTMRLGSRDLTVSQRFILPDTHIVGMAVAGDAVYIADSWKRNIQLWRRGADGLGFEKAWPSPGASPCALFHDGKTLWSADRLERRIYQHAADDSLSVLNAYKARHTPVAIFADSQNFWSADSESRLVYRHRWDPLLSLIGSYSLPELEGGRQPLSAFTLRGEEAWLAKDGSDRLYMRQLWRLRQAPLPSQSD